MTNRYSQNDLNAELLTCQRDVLGENSPVKARVNLNNDARDLGNCSESTSVVPCGEKKQIQSALQTDSGAQANFEDQSTTWRLKALKEVDDSGRERARLQVDPAITESEANQSTSPPENENHHLGSPSTDSFEYNAKNVDLKTERRNIVTASGTSIHEQEPTAATRARKNDLGSIKESVIAQEVNQLEIRQRIDVSAPGLAPKEFKTSPKGEVTLVLYNDGSQLVRQEPFEGGQYKWRATSAEGIDLIARSFEGKVTTANSGALHIEQTWPVPQIAVFEQNGDYTHAYKNGAIDTWDGQKNRSTVHYPDDNVRVLQYAPDQSGKLQVTEYADKKAGTVTHVNDNCRTEPLNGRYTEALASTKPTLESFTATSLRVPEKLPTADEGSINGVNGPVVPIPEKTKIVAQPDPTSGLVRLAFNNSLAFQREAELNFARDQPAGPKAKPAEIAGSALTLQKNVNQSFGDTGLIQPVANAQRREAANLYGGATAEAGNQLLAGVKQNAQDAGFKAAPLSPYAQPQRISTDSGGVSDILHSNGERWVRQPSTADGQQPSWKVYSANGVELANQNFRGTVTQDASGALRVDKTYPVPQRSFQGTDGTYAQEYKNGASVVWNPQDRTQTVFYPTGNTRVLQYEVDPASGKLKVASYADKAAGTVTYVNQGNRVEPLNGKFSEALAATRPNFDTSGAPVISTNQSRSPVTKGALDTPTATPLVSRQALTEPVVPVRGGQGLSQPGRTVDGAEGPLRVPRTDGLLPLKQPLADGAQKHNPADTRFSATNQPPADLFTPASRKTSAVDPRVDATTALDKVTRANIHNSGEINPLTRHNNLGPQADRPATELRVKPDSQRSFTPDSRLNPDPDTAKKLARTFTADPGVTQTFRTQPGLNPDRLPRNTGRGFEQVASLLAGTKPAGSDKSGNLPTERNIRENNLLQDRTKTDIAAARQQSLTAASLSAANQQSLRATERANQLASLQIARENQAKRLSASNDNNQARLPDKNLPAAELSRIASEKILTGKISRERFAEPGSLAARQSAEFRDWLTRINANASELSSKISRSIDLPSSNTSLTAADKQTRQILMDRIAILRNNRDERAGQSQLQPNLQDRRIQKEGSRIVAFDPASAGKDVGGRRTTGSDGRGDRGAGFDGSRRADWRIFEPGRPNAEAVRLENFRVLKMDGRVSCPRHFPTVAECMILGSLLASGIARRQERQQFISQLGNQVSESNSSKPGQPGQRFEVKPDNTSLQDGKTSNVVKGGNPGQRLDGRTDAVLVNDGSKMSGRFEPRTVKIGSGDKAVTMTNDGRTISVSAAGKTLTIGTDGRFAAVDQRPTGADKFAASKFTERSLRIGGCDRKFPSGAEFALLTAVCGIAKWRRDSEGKYPSELRAGQNKTIERFNAIMSKHGIKPNWNGVRDNTPVSLRVTASAEELTRLKEQRSAKVAEGSTDSSERGRNRRWFGKTEIAVSALMLIAAAARMRSDIGNPNSQHFFPEPIITIERTLRRPERKEPQQDYLRDEPPAVRPTWLAADSDPKDKFGESGTTLDDLNKKEGQKEPAAVAAILTNLNRATGDGEYAEEVDLEDSDLAERRRQRGNSANGKKIKNDSVNKTTSEESETGAKQPAQTLYRKTWLVAPGETLVGIAEKEHNDANLGWLIADLNLDRVKETWLEGKRIIEVNARTRLNLPTWDEISEFYANHKAEADPDNLVTITVQQHLDQELVESQLAMAMTLAKRPSTPKPVNNKDLQVPAAPKARKETADILRELKLEESGEVDMPEINWTEHAS